MGRLEGSGRDLEAKRQTKQWDGASGHVLGQETRADSYSRPDEALRTSSQSRSQS